MKVIKSVSNKQTTEATRELTVESALEELREMFGIGVYLMVEDRRIQYPEDVEREPLRMARIHIDRNEFWANTLEETMQKVRAWKAQQ